MDHLDAYDVFVKVVEAQSFSKAATLMHRSQPSVSRIVKSLEKHLGLTLIQRNARHIVITEEGQKLYRFAKEVLEKIEKEESQLQKSIHKVSGLVKMTSPKHFFAHFIQSALPKFYERYPDIQLDIHLSNTVINLGSSDYDLAIRSAKHSDPVYQSQKVLDANRILAASPAYLAKHGTPQHPNELRDHDCLVFNRTPYWEFTDKENQHITVPIQGRSYINSMPALAALAKEDLGIAYLSEYYVLDELKAGELVKVLEDYSQEHKGIYIVHPYQHFVPSRVEVLIEFLKGEVFGD